MRRLLIRFAFAALVLPLGLASCESSTEPRENLAVTLDFGVNRPAFLPDFSTVRSAGTITVRGTFGALCSPTVGSATVVREGNILVVTVSGEPGEGCTGAATAVGYDATVTGIQRLTHLRVVHRWPETEREDAIVFEAVYD